MSIASDTTSLAYFFSEIGRMREAMGQRNFWLSSNTEARRSGAIKAIGGLFLKLNLSPKENEQASIAFESVMMEFTRREMWVDMTFEQA